MHRINTYNEENTIARSERDGWTLGYIGIPWPGPWPKKNGDLFMTDPNGWQVGISWESSGPEILDISGASEGRFGGVPGEVPCRRHVRGRSHKKFPCGVATVEEAESTGNRFPVMKRQSPLDMTFERATFGARSHLRWASQ